MASNRGSLREVAQARTAQQLERAIKAYNARGKSNEQRLRRCLRAKWRKTTDEQLRAAIDGYIAALSPRSQEGPPPPSCRRLSRERSCWY